MIKKVMIALAIAAVLLVTVLNVISRRAPLFLKSNLEKALNRPVHFESLSYHFPGTFELEGFEIKEKAPFQGETSFAVDHLGLEVSPLSLLNKKLLVNKVEVENANIFVRKYRGHLTHPLSGVLKKNLENETVPGGTAQGTSPPKALPLEIDKFFIRKSNFQFIDYDATERGFVMVLDSITAEIRNIVFPFTFTKTSYQVKARLPQGRAERPGEVQISGWTVFASKDTNANLNLQGIFLPYFWPYYAQVTQAVVNNGYLDSRANLRIDKKDLVINVDLEIMGLLFDNYEMGNSLFGLNAAEVLDFMKDRSGRLHFQFVAGWNLGDRSVRARDVIRKSIERSLKNTILGNVGNILENTIQRISERGVGDTKDELEGTLKKFKQLFS